MNKKHFYSSVILLLFLAIGIQPAFAIIYLSLDGWSDPDVGTWDLPTKTGTLTTDVYEMIQISSSGTSTDYLVLDGSGHTVSWVSGPHDQGVYIQEKSYVTIKDLNVQNFDNGIYLVGGSYNTFIGNTVSGSVYGSGILISKSNNMFCTHNTLTDNNVFGNKYGIQLYQSTNNTVTNNTASGNTLYAIFLHLSRYNTLTGNTAENSTSGIGFYLLKDSSNNDLRNNNSLNNITGIQLQGSSYNTVTGNTVSSNSWGIRIRAYDGETSIENQVYNNNFENTTEQQAEVYKEGTGNIDGNVFNLAFPIGGNYWSDWRTPDNDANGVVDLPYVFTGGQDKYPWTEQYGWLNPPPTNQPPIADAGPDQIVEQDSSAGASVTLDGSGSSDPDDDPLTYSWTWDGGSASGISPTVVLPLGTTTITLVVNDGTVDSEPDTVDITVESAESPEAEAIEPIIAVIEGMDPEDAETEMEKAVTELNKAIDEFNNDRIDKALNKIAKAVKQLMKAQKEGANTQGVIDELVALVQGIAEEAIEDAIDTVGADNLHHVVKAQEHYDKACDEKLAGKYDRAIKEFKKAYREAMKALGE